jgi:hypothetical protein
MSNAGRSDRITIKAERNSSEKTPCWGNSPPTYDPSYNYDGGYDCTIDPTLSTIEEEDEELKAMRSVQFAVIG